jgi:hypothetical protein
VEKHGNRGNSPRVKNPADEVVNAL